mmetsp:Transcript_10970/g.16128  ORF Transcript_10970/g.16128 Transcript_10970/m.16128 type:complete len:84 (+) Transcript_10970:1467-1718(+)
MVIKKGIIKKNKPSNLDKKLIGIILNYYGKNVELNAKCRRRKLKTETDQGNEVVNCQNNNSTTRRYRENQYLQNYQDLYRIFV